MKQKRSLSMIAAFLLCGTTAVMADVYVNEDVNPALTQMVQQANTEASNWDGNTFGFDLDGFTESSLEDANSALAQMEDAAQSPAEALDQDTVDEFTPFFQEFDLEGGSLENSSCKILKPTVDYVKNRYTQEDVIGGILVHEGEEPYAFLSDTSYAEQIVNLPIVCVDNTDETPVESLLSEDERPLFIKK